MRIKFLLVHIIKKYIAIRLVNSRLSSDEGNLSPADDPKTVIRYFYTLKSEKRQKCQAKLKNTSSLPIAFGSTISGRGSTAGFFAGHGRDPKRAVPVAGAANEKAGAGRKVHL